jgi:anaerobic selenocysteine-containing dehydrogenase
VIPPAPDELAWLARLAERFGVPLSPYPAVVFEELSAVVYGGIGFGEVGEQAALPSRGEPVDVPPLERPAAAPATMPGLALLTYRPLFSGAAVARVDELQFQRPAPEAELSAVDAERLGVTTGDEVILRSNGTSRSLRARVNRRLVSGVVRSADEHADGLGARVEVVAP